MSLDQKISKTMPNKFSVADGTNSFMLGRKAFFNSNYKSHQIENLAKNNSSTNNLKINRTYSESGNNPKPLPNMSSDLRIQRLRLTAIGSGSSKVNDNNKYSYKSENNNNIINNVKSRVKGLGSGYVPKRNTY